MTKLVLEEGGVQRAFRVGAGILTVGSAANAALRLQSPGVAEVHLELEVGPRGVVLRPKPGVVAPTVGGAPVKSELVLKQGQSVLIGSARLSVEYEPGEGPPEPAVTPVVRTAGARSRAGASGGSAAAKPRAAASGRTRPSASPLSKLLPILGAVGVAVVLFFVVQRVLRKAPSSSMDLGPILVELGKNLEAGDLNSAQSRLETLSAQKLSPAQAEQVKTYRERLEGARSAGQTTVTNIAGTQYLDSQLKNFLENYVGEKAERPPIRVFLKRCAEFRRRWPTHPEMDWVERQERRFQGVVDLTKAADFADIEFEVKALTWSSPRQYAQAFALLEAFKSSAGGADLVKVEGLIESKIAERKTWFDDRMQQARYDFEKNAMAKSVGTLLGVIVHVGDGDMANQAAEQFTRFDDPGSWLRGYRSEKPESFQVLIQNPVIAAYLAQHPL